MDYNKLKEDLLDKCNNRYSSVNYFTKSLFDNEQIYYRRSFNDLIEYYSNKGVTEKMLMQALKELKFHAYYCNIPKRVVFLGHSPRVKFWCTAESQEEAFEKSKRDDNNFGKYTPEYLEELYDSV
jgi:hypothetical protein